MVSSGDQLSIEASDLLVRRLGEPTVASPMARLLRGRASSPHYVHESDRVLLDDTVKMAVARGCAVGELPSFEPGGPREYIYFDPAGTRVGIVTCGGLCPGLNNVIRGLVLELSENYGVTDIVGFRNGYRGLANGEEPMPLTPALVADIHNRGGTILGTSRGGQDTSEMVKALIRLRVSVLMVIGGDGTLRAAEEIADAAAARGVMLSVVGVPKTIDNDVPYIDHSFGFQTAFARATDSIKAAHTEASSTPNGVGLVKLMGRHSGFIACYAALASHDVDFVLIPEVPVRLDGAGGFLACLRRRAQERGHAVIVVAEGAGQDLIARDGARDASGNARLADIGRLGRSSACATWIPDMRSAASPPMATTRCSASGWPRPPCTRRCRGGRRWSSAAGTGASCTCPSPWRPAAVIRSTRTATCGCRCSRRPASRRVSADAVARSAGRGLACCCGHTVGRRPPSMTYWLPVR
jgi:6-phosphofructokinase 1